MCLQDASPQSGLLQSSIITMYTMYVTWSAMTNNPSKSRKKISENMYSEKIPDFGPFSHCTSFHYEPTQVDAFFGEFCGVIKTRYSTFIDSLPNKAKLPVRIQIMNLALFTYILLWSSMHIMV